METPAKLSVPNCVQHGPMTCDRCWKTASDTVQEAGTFQLVRDPGHWGSSRPSTLVLGVSKGNTQSTAFGKAPFVTIAFKGIRNRLFQVLQTVGLLPGESAANFDRRFHNEEQTFAFASVVRCSLTGMDPRKGFHTADSPNVIPAFKPGSSGYRFVSACVEQHLGRLPKETQCVVLLGNTDAYIKNLRELVRHSRGTVQQINNVAYRTGDVLFVHVSHPSKGNGHFGAFIRGEGTPGQKMLLAREAVASA